MISFLMHEDQDTVGVAVADLKNGQNAKGRSLHGKAAPALPVLSDIPLGHKIALRDFKPGDAVIKYGVDIGKIVAAVKKGEHVHVHNLKTKRW